MVFDPQPHQAMRMEQRRADHAEQQHDAGDRGHLYEQGRRLPAGAEGKIDDWACSEAPHAKR